MRAVTDPVTYSTEYWRLTLPSGWQHEPADDEDCFAVESEDGSKKVLVRTLFPGSNQSYDVSAAVTQFEEAITDASRKTLKPTHRRFVTERGSLPPYSTLLLATYDEDNHFGLAAMTFVAGDHRLCISIHDYWSDDQLAFERFFRDILQRFRPVTRFQE